MNNSSSIDAVIITALQVEEKAIVKCLHLSLPEWINNRMCYRTTVSIPGDTCFHNIVFLPLNNKGKAAAASATTFAIITWQPKYIILTGIVAGVRKDEHRFGDIIVPRRIIDYGSGKQSTSGFKSEKEQYRSHSTLLQAAKHIPLEWAKNIELPPRPDGKSEIFPQTHFDGDVLSDDVVVKDPIFRDQLRQQWSKMDGIEMEGTGTAAAVYESGSSVGVLLVKGISDWADEKKNDEWHEYASAAAAGFVVELLRTLPPINKEIPPFHLKNFDNEVKEDSFEQQATEVNTIPQTADEKDSPQDSELQKSPDRSPFTSQLLTSQSLPSQLKPEASLEKFSAASVNLLSTPNTLFGDHHLNRQDVSELLDWINRSLPENKPPIAILTGKAGSGKSVILRDVLEALQASNIPVWGIKADLQADVERLTEMKETVLSTGEKCKKVIVLLDQIDAFSLCATEDRRVLKVYIDLIAHLRCMKNVKIILGCRTFDLEYDPLLRPFKDNHTINVQDLSEETIFSVLLELGIEKGRVSKTFIELLKVPLHVKIFCDTYRKGTNLASLPLLQELYDTIWNLRISLAEDLPDVLNALKKVTRSMDKTQSLSVPFALLDRDETGRRYLLSQSLLVGDAARLQFFHPSFFDYCYSRIFVCRSH